MDISSVDSSVLESMVIVQSIPFVQQKQQQVEDQENLLSLKKELFNFTSDINLDEMNGFLSKFKPETNSIKIQSTECPVKINDYTPNQIQDQDYILKVGKSSDNNITVQSQAMSRLHFTIEKQILQDKASSNGTFISFSGLKVINDYDIVEVGNVEIQFRIFQKENCLHIKAETIRGCQNKILKEVFLKDQETVNLGSSPEQLLSFPIAGIKISHIILKNMSNILFYTEGGCMKNELVYKRLSDEKKQSDGVRIFKGMKIKVIKCINLSVD